MMCRQEANGKKRKRQVNRRVPSLPHQDNYYVTTRFDRTILCILTKSHQVVEVAIRSLMGTGTSQPLVVGLGVIVTAHQQAAVATIQLCYHNYCLIYHMFGQPSFPPSLKKFLFNPDITFACYSSPKEVEILKRDAGFDVDLPYLDLADLVVELYSVYNDLSLLSTLVLEYVDFDMRPDARWDVEFLSGQQVEYASFSTYLSLQIGSLLLRAEAGNPPRNAIYRWKEVERVVRQIRKVQIFERTIVTDVTKRLIAAEKWIADVARYRHLYPCVGFDIELITVNNQPSIGTVQFCVRSRCLIIQFNQMQDPYLPNLERFLLESHNTFVGVDIKWKMRMLIDSLLFADGGRLKCVDLGMCATDLYRRPELNIAGHEELARVVLETRVEMPADVDADWGRPWLSVAQVEHACIRTAVPYELGSRMLPPRE